MDGAGYGRIGDGLVALIKTLFIGLFVLFGAGLFTGWLIWG